MTVSNEHTACTYFLELSSPFGKKLGIAPSVTLAPLKRYCLTPIQSAGLVFGFGSATPEDILRGIDILRELPALR